MDGPPYAAACTACFFESETSRAALAICLQCSHTGIRKLDGTSPHFFAMHCSCKNANRQDAIELPPTLSIKSVGYRLRIHHRNILHLWRSYMPQAAGMESHKLRSRATCTSSCKVFSRRGTTKTRQCVFDVPLPCLSSSTAQSLLPTMLPARGLKAFSCTRAADASFAWPHKLE